ncbi:hypothetical protein GCM10010467_23500 [Actinocorallia glomerata]|uniref:Uncharacterized protein n=1 Tax=Actinocorallia glomerata TaxID=46203 RepID=A0ABP6PRE5_9ACTN
MNGPREGSAWPVMVYSTVLPSSDGSVSVGRGVVCCAGALAALVVLVVLTG